MTERAKHISSSFDAALYGLKNDVLMMSSTPVGRVEQLYSQVASSAAYRTQALEHLAQ